MDRSASGAGAGAAVVAVVAQARARARPQLARRPARRPRAALPRGRVRRGRRWPARSSCSCSSPPGCSSSPGAGARRAALHAWPVALAQAATLTGLAWTAFKVGALSFGGGFVIIPLMQEDAVDRHGWMTAGRVPQRGRLRPAHAGPGHAHGRAGRLGRVRPRRGAARQRDRVRAVVPRGRPAAAHRFGRLRGNQAGPRVPRRRRPGRGRRDPRRRRRRWSPRSRSRGRARCSPRPRWCSLLGRAPLWALAGGALAGLARGARRRPAAVMRLPSPAMDLQAEATDVLSRLIRFDTVNPPGDERACQEWLKALPRGRRPGVRAAPPDEAPERPNLVARLRGDGRRPRPRLPLARRHGARRRRRLAARPVVGRRARRRRSGAVARST